MSAAEYKCLAKAGESGIGPTVFKLLSLLFSVFFPFSYSFLYVLYQFVREMMTFQPHGSWTEFRRRSCWQAGCEVTTLGLSFPVCSVFLTSVPVTASQPGTFHTKPGIPLWEAGGSRLLCSRFLLISLLPSLFQGLWQCGRVPQPTIPRHSCVPWRDGRKPTRLSEADNHRCF